jgi:hypothetical protein
MDDSSRGLNSDFETLFSFFLSKNVKKTRSFKPPSLLLHTTPSSFLASNKKGSKSSYFSNLTSLIESTILRH